MPKGNNKKESRKQAGDQIEDKNKNLIQNQQQKTVSKKGRKATRGRPERTWNDVIKQFI